MLAYSLQQFISKVQHAFSCENEQEMFSYWLDTVGLMSRNEVYHGQLVMGLL